MAKIGHDAKAIAFAKWSVWVKNKKCQNRCQKRFYDHTRVVVCKKPLLKTPTIRKMRAFGKWPKLATTQRL